MHTSIQLDMHWPTRDTLLTCRLDECIQQTEGIDLWFQIVVEHRLESRHLRVHHHDIGGDACLTERHALIGHSHSQIIDALILQCLGYLHSTCTIGICLDHAHHLRVGMEERAEVVQIIDHRIQIHLKDGLVNFLLQLFRDEVEAKRTGTLQKNQFVVQTSKGLARQEMGHTGEELLIGNLNLISLRHQFGTDTDELLDATLHGEVAHLGIERFWGRTRLEHITEDERLFQHPLRLTTVHEVEGDIERVDVTVIRVVDQQATALSFLHL